MLILPLFLVGLQVVPPMLTDLQSKGRPCIWIHIGTWVKLKSFTLVFMFHSEKYYLQNQYSFVLVTYDSLEDLPEFGRKLEGIFNEENPNPIFHWNVCFHKFIITTLNYKYILNDMKMLTVEWSETRWTNMPHPISIWVGNKKTQLFFSLLFYDSTHENLWANELAGKPAPFFFFYNYSLSSLALMGYD